MSLREANLAAFKGALGEFLKTFSERPPASTLIEQGEDWNVLNDGIPVFADGAKKASERLVAAARKGPARILFGKPSLLFKDPSADRAAVDGSFEFLTQKYDDVNQDAHVLDFHHAVANALHGAGIEVGEKMVRDRPYFVVSYGVGLGFHLEMLWEAWRPKNLIVLEPDRDMLLHSLDVFDWAALISRMREGGAALTLIIDESAKKMLQRLNAAVQGDCIIGLDGLTSVKISNHPVINVVFSEFQSAKTANLASYIGYIVDEYNMMKNSFRNLRDGKHRILSHVRKHPQMPALIVGSGPSLEQNLDFVRAVREKVILIASGSSLAVLLRNGIVPDLQAVLERAKGNYERHVELSKEFDLKQIVAILTTTIWPGTPGFFKETIFFLRPALSPLAVFCHDQAEVLQGEGPQVTNSAFAFAARLGFKELYLLGVDLGSRDPARPRAERAWLTPGLKQRELNLPVRGNFGRTVFTDNPLIQQRMTIEAQIEKIRKSGGKVWNLGDGVRIVGAEAQRPETVDLPEPKVDRVSHVDELVAQFPIFTRERFVSDWESSHVRESVAKMVRALSDTVLNAEEWDHDVIKKLEKLNQYVGKPVKQQYAPRLLRGSVLRMCMLVQAIMLRVSEEDAPKALEAIKPVWADMMGRLERESYELADELESEDEYFSHHG